MRKKEDRLCGARFHVHEISVEGLLDGDCVLVQEDAIRLGFYTEDDVWVR